MADLITHVSFSIGELWYIRSVCRHESADQGQWKAPPTSLELNTHISEAILMCEDNKIDEVYIPLTLKDCLLLDYVVDQGAKDVKGILVGKPILLKSFAARRHLTGGHEATAEEEEPNDWRLLLGEFEKNYDSSKRRRSKKAQE